MRSGSRFHGLLAQLESEGASIQSHECSRILYSRSFLLSLGGTERCRYLPRDFDTSMSGEFEDASTGLLKLPLNLDSGRSGSLSRGLLRNPSNDGLLGKGAAMIVLSDDSAAMIVQQRCMETISSLKVQCSNDSTNNALKKSAKPYRPPHFYQMMPHSGRGSIDSVSKDTSGSNTSCERDKEERGRKDSFQLTRNDQHTKTSDVPKAEDCGAPPASCGGSTKCLLSTPVLTSTQPTEESVTTSLEKTSGTESLTIPSLTEVANAEKCSESSDQLHQTTSGVSDESYQSCEPNLIQEVFTYLEQPVLSEVNENHPTEHEHYKFPDDHDASSHLLTWLQCGFVQEDLKLPSEPSNATSESSELHLKLEGDEKSRNITRNRSKSRFEDISGSDISWERDKEERRKDSFHLTRKGQHIKTSDAPKVEDCGVPPASYGGSTKGLLSTTVPSSRHPTEESVSTSIEKTFGIKSPTISSLTEVANAEKCSESSDQLHETTNGDSEESYQSCEPNMIQEVFTYLEQSFLSAFNENHPTELEELYQFCEPNLIQEEFTYLEQTVLSEVNENHPTEHEQYKSSEDHDASPHLLTWLQCGFDQEDHKPSPEQSNASSESDKLHLKLKGDEKSRNMTRLRSKSRFEDTSGSDTNCERDKEERRRKDSFHSTRKDQHIKTSDAPKVEDCGAPPASHGGSTKGLLSTTVPSSRLPTEESVSTSLAKTSGPKSPTISSLTEAANGEKCSESTNGDSEESYQSCEPNLIQEVFTYLEQSVLSEVNENHPTELEELYQCCEQNLIQEEFAYLEQSVLSEVNENHPTEHEWYKSPEDHDASSHLLTWLQCRIDQEDLKPSPEQSNASSESGELHLKLKGNEKPRNFTGKRSKSKFESSLPHNLIHGTGSTEEIHLPDEDSLFTFDYSRAPQNSDSSTQADLARKLSALGLGMETYNVNSQQFRPQLNQSQVNPQTACFNPPYAWYPTNAPPYPYQQPLAWQGNFVSPPPVNHPQFGQAPYQWQAYPQVYQQTVYGVLPNTGFGGYNTTQVKSNQLYWNQNMNQNQKPNQVKSIKSRGKR